ncbi:MAG TPA: hypothetical protein PLY93_03785 [Turneriella sp.]|nr:hypothetical protein [Turneriella sp.]
MIAWVKRIRFSDLFINLVVGFGALAVAFGLMRTVTRLRMYELRDSLQSFNEKNDEVRNISLLSRISLLTQSAINNNGETTARYKQEAESALITIQQARAQSEQPSLVDRMALPVLNAFNFITGLPRLNLGGSSKKEMVLDLAFQFESFREYAKAVKGYSVFLNDFRLTTNEREFALLHKGFSSAMLGDFASAKKDFENVVKNPLSANVEIAQKLIDFITTLDVQIKKIESVQNDALRGELYYNAAAYTKALENFARIEKNTQTEKIQFLTARSLEETGRSKEATAIYRKLIKNGSTYAVNANRRMYLLGTFLGGDKNLAQESKTNSETVVKDAEFMQNFQHLEKSATELNKNAALEKERNGAQLKEITALVKVEDSPPAIKELPPVVNPTEEAKPPPKPKVINLRNEKIAERAEKLDTTKKEEVLKKQPEKIDKLTMEDGNVFVGVVYKETVEQVSLYSTMGNLDLDKSKIIKREKVIGEKAFK